MGVSCVRDAEGGGERSEPPVLPCGHYGGIDNYESSIRRLKIAITKEQECHKDYRSDSEARSSPTRAKWHSHERGARPKNHKYSKREILYF